MRKSFALIGVSALLIQAQVPNDSSDNQIPTDSVIAQTDTAYSDSEYESGTSNQEYDDSEYIDSESVEKTGYSTFRFSLGASYFDLKSLNEQLSSAGLPSLDNASFQFGFGRTTQKTRLVLDYGLLVYSWRNAHNNDRKSDLTSAVFSLNYGFDLLKQTHVSLFPYAGANLGALLLKTSYKDLPFNEVVTGKSHQDEILHKITITAQAGLGFDIRKKRDGLMPSIGFRAGYQFDLSDYSKWYRGMSSVSNGPDASTSGPFANIVFGIALPR